MERVFLLLVDEQRHPTRQLDEQLCREEMDHPTSGRAKGGLAGAMAPLTYVPKNFYYSINLYFLFMLREKYKNLSYILINVL